MADRTVSNQSTPESIGLVLAGGGARGAYEIGALSALLPWLEEEHRQRPQVFVGTSVGALNAAYLGANADESAEDVTQAASLAWRGLEYRDVLSPFVSREELATAWRFALSVVSRQVRPHSLLDPRPLTKTLAELIPSFERIHQNVEDEQVPLSVCAVVATAAHTNRSVVFHDGGPNPQSDERRGIDYVATEINESHIRASAAIPLAFPAVRVEQPSERKGWYFDGGTRLNTPIKPALELGAKRVIVIGLNSLAAAPLRRERADLFDGASQLIQGLLIDPLVNDLETLVTINQTLIANNQEETPDGKHRVVPYIFVAPKTPDRIGEIAQEVFSESYGARALLRSERDLALLGRLLGAGVNPTRGELFSYLFFAPEFARRLLQLGREDAERWISAHHGDAWERGALPTT